MTSLLQPSYALTLGSQRWTEQALSLEVRLETAPLVDAVTVRFPAAAPLSAAVGDPAELTLNNGEKEQRVFTGGITAVRREMTGLCVTALNAGGTLAGFRPAVTYEKMTAGTVIRNLAEEVGVEVGDVEDGVALAFYVADPSRSALEHIARVCGWSGAMGRVSPDNQLEAVIVTATQAEVALRFGRELLSFEHRMLPSVLESFVAAGEGGAGDTSAPEVFRPTTDFFAGNRPDGPSSSHRWSWEPALRTAQAAATAGAARMRVYNATRERGRLTAFLQPDVRPGTILEVQDLPDGLPRGPFWVHRVRHWIGPHGALTEAHFRKGGESFDPLSLLGSLASAVGEML
jgi:hypothetical protein